jgi:predicted transcriptional regulator
MKINFSLTKDEPKETTSLRFEPQIKRKMRALGKKLDMSNSALISELIQQAYEQQFDKKSNTISNKQGV